MPQNNLPEPGEFTRIFKRQHAAAQGGAEADKKASEITARFPAAAVSPDVPQQPEVAPPGPTPIAPTPASNSSEPGEFTRYFMGGLPTKSANSTAAHRTPVGVQRPNSPVPPPKSPVSDGSGTFSERFGPRIQQPVQQAEEFGVHNPRLGAAPDLSLRPLTDETDPFGYHQPLPTPSKRDVPGEFTSLFGRGEMPPAPKQFAVAQPPAPPIMSDSPNAVRGPSEFTVVSNGRQTAPAAGGGGRAPEPQADSRKLPFNVNLSPINPLGSLASGGGVHFPGASASASLAGAHLNTPLGGVNVQAPSMPPLKMDGGAAGAGAVKGGDYTKLILFFGALAVLAVILVVVVVATQKN